MEGKSNARPVVVVSRCLGFAVCRWDGETTGNDFIINLQDYITFIPVCPEVEIGLGVPRDPIWLVAHKNGERLLQPDTGRDLTSLMNRFARGHLKSLPPVDGFILKAKSPSCGIRRVKRRAGLARRPLAGFTTGLYARKAMERFLMLPIEDELRLKFPLVRKRFLTGLFLHSAFREVCKAGTIEHLRAFHISNCNVFDAFGKRDTAAMTQRLEVGRQLSFKTMICEYEQWMSDILLRRPRRDYPKLFPMA